MDIINHHENLAAVRQWFIEAGVYYGYPKISDDIAVQARYVAGRIDGDSHELSRTLALRTVA